MTNYHQKRQTGLIHGTEWDYLLLLDCFRWDYFEEMYQDHLDGTAEPVWSAGSHTLHWLAETWPGEYPDITYVSGHALINSEGIPSMPSVRTEAKSEGVDGDYIPADHFPDIIDVWDFGYEEGFETVSPWNVNAVLTGAEAPDPPVIAHYVQPHFPWIRGHIYAEEHDLDVGDDYRREWNPGRTGEGLPRFTRGRVREMLGMEGVKMAYRDNCRVALDAVSDVVGSLNGTVVVTSDHGELFEEGVTHPPGRDDAELRTVPWLVIP